MQPGSVFREWLGGVIKDGLDPMQASLGPLGVEMKELEVLYKASALEREAETIINVTRKFHLKDFATKNTKNFSAYYKSEREARNLARQKLGKNPIEVEPNKFRSVDGKWQYRAKPGDVSEKHIHLEELNPSTGEVLQNYHLRW